MSIQSLLSSASVYRLAGENEKKEGNFMAAEWFFEQAADLEFEAKLLQKEEPKSFADTLVQFLVNSSKMELNFCPEFTEN